MSEWREFLVGRYGPEFLDHQKRIKESFGLDVSGCPVSELLGRAQQHPLLLPLVEDYQRTIETILADLAECIKQG